MTARLTLIRISALDRKGLLNLAKHKSITSDTDVTRQRIDRWLWHARVVKTRSQAQALAISGRVRVNKQRVGAASEFVRIGDIVTISLNQQVRVLEVTGFLDRRGDATHARSSFEDLTPPAQKFETPVSDRESSDVVACDNIREPGGRPTKKARRTYNKIEHGMQ